MNWFGIPIKKKFVLKSINILFGDLTVIIVSSSNLRNKFELLDFSTVVSFFCKREGVSVIFGLFSSPLGKFSRVKVKSNFYSSLNLTNVIYLLEGDNMSAYYESGFITESFIGLEIRFHFNAPESPESLVSEVLRDVGRERNKVFKNFNEKI